VPRDRLHDQRAVQELIAPLAARLRHEQAAVARRAVQGALVEARLRVVIRATGSLEQISSRSSACAMVPAMRGASAIRPPSVPCAPADAV
jgi:hypothetical protein